MSDIFVKTVGLKKAYNGHYVLKGIGLEIRKGEIHCLCGGNGCGKSTLIKSVSGVIQPTEGEIYINGERMRHMNPIDVIKRGIQVIYQDFAVFPNLTVAENISVNFQIKNRKKTVNYKSMREEALSVMKIIGAKINPDAILEDLPVSDKQMVALCRALLNEPKMLILDEPTTALTALEVNKLWEVLRKLREKDIAILLVDHKFDEIRPLADRLTVIRNGDFISSGTIDEYDHRRFQIDITGHDFLNEKYSPKESEDRILTVTDLSSKGNFENISFTLNKGDVLGITGLLGSGRNEIAEALFGLCPIDSGHIVLNGKEIEVKSVRDAVKNEIGFVPEDRLSQGLFTSMTICDNIGAASLKKYYKNLHKKSTQLKEDAVSYIKRLGIKTSSPENPVSSLSGGNAQKVVLSKWLNTNPKLLVLVGPSVGMDIGAKAEIHRILHELAGNGIGIIMVTDDLPELTENCNKILIVRDHRIIKETDNTISKKQIELLLMGEKGMVTDEE